MIGKFTKGKDIKALLNCLLSSKDLKGDDRSRCNIIGGTIPGDTPEDLAHEFERWKATRPRVSVIFAHQEMRLAPEDLIPDDATWNMMAEFWCRRMDFDNYVTICHGDHLHIVACRINQNGTLVEDWYDYLPSEGAFRQIEREFNLTEHKGRHLMLYPV